MWDLGRGAKCAGVIKRRGSQKLYERKREGPTRRQRKKRTRTQSAGFGKTWGSCALLFARFWRDSVWLGVKKIKGGTERLPWSWRPCLSPRWGVTFGLVRLSLVHRLETFNEARPPGRGRRRPRPTETTSGRVMSRELDHEATAGKGRRSLLHKNPCFSVVVAFSLPKRASTGEGDSSNPFVTFRLPRLRSFSAFCPLCFVFRFKTNQTCSSRRLFAAYGWSIHESFWGDFVF